jgi:hypothetical protein
LRTKAGIEFAPELCNLMAMQGKASSLFNGVRRTLPVWAAALALSAHAQFGLGWKQAMGSHELCCGPRGGFMGDSGAGGLHLPPELAEMVPAKFAPESAFFGGSSANAVLVTTAAGATAAMATGATTVSVPEKFERTAGGYDLVGFDLLASFEFVAPEYDPAGPNATPPSGAHQIPAPIKALDQRKVAVTGFMLPTKMEGGLVKEFLLVKDAMLCCYGAMPKINEWVVVKMTGKGVRPLMDVPITFEGKLNVGEMYENGYLTGLYLLDGDRMTDERGVAAR